MLFSTRVCVCVLYTIVSCMRLWLRFESQFFCCWAYSTGEQLAGILNVLVGIGNSREECISPSNGNRKWHDISAVGRNGDVLLCLKFPTLFFTDVSYFEDLYFTVVGMYIWAPVSLLLLLASLLMDRIRVAIDRQIVGAAVWRKLGG